MGLRGPKPVDVKYLQGDAAAWAAFLYTLRDGQPGHMQRVKWGPVRSTGSARATPVQAGRGRIILSPHMRYRAGEPLSAPILIRVSDAARQMPVEMKTKDWVIARPIMPAPELWKLLKEARSVREVHKASRGIRSWMKEFGGSTAWLLPGVPALEFPDELERNAERLLAGKRLPSYATTNRPTSDDKRIEFLAKVLAGGRYDLAPITAAKRLSHWHWPKDWAEKPLREYVEWATQEFKGA